MAKFFAAIVILIDFLGALPIILHLWPMPPNISTTGRAIDGQMLETVVEVGALFLAAQFLLGLFVLEVRWLQFDDHFRSCRS